MFEKLNEKEITGNEFQFSSKKMRTILIISGSIIIVLLATSIIFGYLYFTKPDSNTTDKEKSPLKPSFPVKFVQPSESTPAKTIIIHIPSNEVFMSTLHPAAFLYQDVTSHDEIQKNFDAIIKYLNENNISVITVKEALQLNDTKIRTLAFKSLKFQKGTEPTSETNEEIVKKYNYYLSDEYKNDILSKLTREQLIEVILTKPFYNISYTETNTFVSADFAGFNPVGNLVFCRDQQITTAKGVVIGHLRSPIREEENDILNDVFINIGSTPIGRVTTEGYLEGGDFFVAKKDLSMLGVGMRTTMGGAGYLMDKDLLGTRYMAIVYDYGDKDQDRMHLDTIFNILNDHYAIALDFTTVPNKEDVNRKVFLYDNEATVEPIESEIGEVKNVYGNYKLIEKFDDFYEFVEKKAGFKIIKVTHQQQLDYMINFLNIGNNKVISVHPDLADVVKKGGCDAEVTFIDYTGIKKMYGAAHCSTQVSRG